jgi:hypothetical protein
MLSISTEVVAAGLQTRSFDSASAVAFVAAAFGGGRPLTYVGAGL